VEIAVSFEGLISVRIGATLSAMVESNLTCTANVPLFAFAEESIALNKSVLKTPFFKLLTLAEYLPLSDLVTVSESVPKRHFTLATPLRSKQDIIMVSAPELTLELS
jgi:hypothetical protein